MCSINQLPVEVLSYLLLFTFTHQDLRQMPTAHNTAHVCLLWRAIVTDTPEFWTTVTNSSNESNIKLKLRKSANANLNIFYSESCYVRYLPHSLLARPFLDLIIPHKARWSSITVEGLPHAFLRSLSEYPPIPNGRLPLLTLRPQSPWQERTISLERIPSDVVSIRVEGVFRSWGLKSNYALTSFELGGSLRNGGEDELTAIIRVLNACPNLRTLRIGPLTPTLSTARLATSRPLDGGNSAAVMAPSLEELEIRGAGSALFSGVLKRVTMPKLSRLLISIANHARSFDIVGNSLSCEVDGHSVLQSVIQNAGCHSLVVSVARTPTLEWIKLYGVNSGRRSLEVKLLRRAGIVTGDILDLRRVTIPVQINVVGSVSGSVLPLLKRTPSVSLLRYRPHMDSEWQTLAVQSGDLARLPLQWEHTRGPPASTLLAFIRKCYNRFSTEMRHGDPLRGKRMREIEQDFDTTREWTT